MICNRIPVKINPRITPAIYAKKAPDLLSLASGNISARLAKNRQDKSSISKYAPAINSNTTNAADTADSAITLEFFIGHLMLGQQQQLSNALQTIERQQNSIQESPPIMSVGSS